MDEKYIGHLELILATAVPVPLTKVNTKKAQKSLRYNLKGILNSKLKLNELI